MAINKLMGSHIVNVTYDKHGYELWASAWILFQYQVMFSYHICKLYKETDSINIILTKIIKCYYQIYISDEYSISQTQGTSTWLDAVFFLPCLVLYRAKGT